MVRFRFFRCLALCTAIALAGATSAAIRGRLSSASSAQRPNWRRHHARPIGEPSRVLLQSTAQGLVRFDASGQIEPGLAERWIVIDNGMSYIFRLRDARVGETARYRNGR